MQRKQPMQMSQVALRKESVDRNIPAGTYKISAPLSLSARRAWIEIRATGVKDYMKIVALRKESVDRNEDKWFRKNYLAESLSARRAWIEIRLPCCRAWAEIVALRKESVDRNACGRSTTRCWRVALRKESVDRNAKQDHVPVHLPWSLSARRAWIEIFIPFYYSYSGCVALRKESVDRNAYWLPFGASFPDVALRKESVDRNSIVHLRVLEQRTSLSARRAWIEILHASQRALTSTVALRKESVDRNLNSDGSLTLSSVALRKESVDRNFAVCEFLHVRVLSLSARRAWIEMTLKQHALNQ